MAVTDKEKVDIVSIDKLSGEVKLTISDHLDWSDEFFHLQTLQEKINSYIEFIEGGQIYLDYPLSNGRKLVIQIVSKYDFTDLGKEFLEKAEPIVKSIGAELRQIRFIED